MILYGWRGKFGHFTPDEKKAFEVTDSLSGGTLISALAEKYMDGHTQLLKDYGLHLRQNLMFLILVGN